MRLLLKGGHICDGRTGVDGVSDLLVDQGRIAGFSDDGEQADMTIDCRERYIIPQIIDIHTHCFPGYTKLGVDKNQLGFLQNIGTIVDAGSSGSEHFKLFEETVVSAPGTEVYEFINYSKLGLTEDGKELSDYHYFDEAELENVILQNRERIKGVKLRASASVVGSLGLEPIRRGVLFAHRLGLPVMIHIGNYPPSIEEVLQLVSKGDIITHTFHGKEGGIFRKDGKLKAEVLEARARGVLFDVGHGSASFDEKVAEKAIHMGFLPDFISSDLHSRNYGKTIGGLAEIISKGLKCGLSIRNVIECVSIRPAELLEMDTRIEKGKTARLNIVSVRNGVEFQVDGLILGERIQWGKGYGQTGNQKCCR